MRRPHFSAIAFAIAVLTGSVADPSIGAEDKPASEDYPTQTVTMVVPFGAAGASDNLGRLIAHRMQKSLGQTVAVENVVGEIGATGASRVAKSKPDGYTILLASNTVLSITPRIGPIVYDSSRDFAPIGRIAAMPMVLVVPPSGPKSLAELVKKARAGKGRLKYGSGGIGSIQHMTAALFERSNGLDMAHIPYRGLAPALSSVLSGDTDLLFVDHESVKHAVSIRKLRMLAVTGPRRIAEFLSVPTMAEAGFPDSEVTVSYALVAPAGTPPAIIARLNAALRDAMNDPSMVRIFSAMMLEPLPGTPDDLARAIAADNARWFKVISEAGIKLN